MTDATEFTIDLDRKTRALRSGNRWAIQRLGSTGSWDSVDYWVGDGRSVLQWCAEHGVHPTREAEGALGLLPITQGFRER